MPVKSNQRGATDAARFRDRTNTITTVASKKTTSTSRRNPIGANYVKPGSGNTRISSATTSIIITTNVQQFDQLQGPKMITVVDDTNIDEVLSLSDLSRVPQSFITEIQQDKVYETILEELRKKAPHRIAPKSPVVQDDEDQPKQFSPHLLAIDNDDDDVSVDDEISSSSSDDDDGRLSPVSYDTDIDIESNVAVDHDPTGVSQYRELCQQAKIIPCSYFMAHIRDTELVLRYHQYSTDDIRAITKILGTNLDVESLLLDGNYLRQQAAKYVTQLILANESITKLSLADNRLGGDEGTKEICRLLTLNRNLKKINLSGNKLNEVDIERLVESLQQNKILRELNLSNNGFGEQCGKILATYISTNDSLESVDLSWNNFRGRSGIDIVAGVKDNIRMRRCNLEMNGLGPEAGPIIAECIKTNSALEELNISGNRLNTTNAFAIAFALSSNDTLEVLKIANNQINSDGVLAIFLCIKGNENTGLRLVDFGNTVVDDETITICKEITTLKNGKFEYHVGKVTSTPLKPNSVSELYLQRDEQLLDRLRANAAKVKPSVD